MKKQLHDFFFEHEAKRVDKWEQYLGMYQSELTPFVDRGAPVRLLEIGVHNGGSLELWSKYLPPGSAIRGIDIDEKVGELSFKEANVTATVADATDPKKIKELFGDDAFDIIIDDGSHHSSHVIASFRLLYPHLSTGGKYIIEDLHCSYFPAYGGGFRARQSSIEWLKRLIDVLNADHIAESDRVSTTDQELIASLGTSLARIAFYDSVAVVEKLPAEKNRPYRRVLSGLQTHVLPEEQWVLSQPIGVFRPMLFEHTAARHLEAKLVDRLEETQVRVGKLDGSLARIGQDLHEARLNSSAAIAERDRRIEELTSVHAAAQSEIEQLSRDIADRDQHLRKLVDSHEQYVSTIEKTGDRNLARLALELKEAYRRQQHLDDELGSMRRSWSFRLYKMAIAMRRRLDTVRRRLLHGRAEALFAAQWYLRQYPDVAHAGIDPFGHYILNGAVMGRNPHPLFDTAWYLATNPEVANSGVNPLVHFVHHCARELRSPHPLFDYRWYVERCPGAHDGGGTALEHYLGKGAAEGLDPHPLFDTSWYLSRNPDVAASGTNPLLHFVEFGARELRNPHPLFDCRWYVEAYPDVLRAGVNPLKHYLIRGASEGRDPSPAFDTDWYRATYVEVGSVNPLVHYVLVGIAKGLQPNPHANAASRG